MVKIPGPDLEVDEDGVPNLYNMAWQIYDYMQANLEGSLFEDTYQMYEGKITDEVEAEFGITASQYSRAMKLLKDVEAVSRISRSTNGSKWILLYRPTEKNFDDYKEQRAIRLKKPTKMDRLEQRVHDLVIVVNSLDARLSELEALLPKQESDDGTDSGES
jgi:hypothetical protein